MELLTGQPFVAALLSISIPEQTALISFKSRLGCAAPDCDLSDLRVNIKVKHIIMFEMWGQPSGSVYGATFLDITCSLSLSLRLSGDEGPGKLKSLIAFWACDKEEGQLLELETCKEHYSQRRSRNNKKLSSSLLAPHSSFPSLPLVFFSPFLLFSSWLCPSYPFPFNAQWFNAYPHRLAPLTSACLAMGWL